MSVSGSGSVGAMRATSAIRGGRVERAGASARSRAREAPADDQHGGEHNDEWVSAWSAALDDLELDVEQAERLLTGQADGDAGTDDSPEAQVLPAPAQRRRTPHAPAVRTNGAVKNPANRSFSRAYNPMPAQHFAGMSSANVPAHDSTQLSSLVPPARRPSAGEHDIIDHRGQQELAQELAAQVALASEHALDQDYLDPTTGGGDGPADQPWSAPDLPGALPAELAERAAALLNRQLAVAQTLARAMLGNRQQTGLLERMDHTPNETRSAYFDHSA